MDALVGGQMRKPSRGSEQVRRKGKPGGSGPRDATRGGVNAPALPVQRGRERPLSVMPVRLGFVCSVLCAVLAPARADGVADEADLQFTVGAEAYRKGEYTAALEHFLASNRLVSNRNVKFNIARAYEQLGRFPDAYRYYIDATRGDAGDGKLQRDVTAALARIGSRVAVMTIETSPPGATIFLDRRDLGSVGTSPAQLGLKAGTYTVIAEFPGYVPATL